VTALVLTAAVPRVEARASVGLWRKVASVPVLALVLAVCAVVPGLNLAALGYLLEVQGRLARGVRFFDALPGLRFALGFARAVVLSWLWLLPLRVLAGLGEDAGWIDPGGNAAGVLGVVRVAAVLLIGGHIGVALARGGTWSAFFRPFKARGSETSQRTLAAALEELRPLALFLDGARAAFVALLWLAVPVGLMWLSRVGPARPGLGILGAALLVPVLFVLPFTQARFGVTGANASLFDWRAARAAWRRAPLSALFAHLALAVLTTPLYLLTIVIAPHDAQWPAALIFIAALLPARAAIALALRRAEKKNIDAPRWLRFSVAPLTVAVLVAWAALLLLTPAIDHRGALGLWVPHAFVLPAPF
jgi:hypothetical protein